MQRVVVTGLGVVSSLGIDLESFRNKLFSAQGGIGPITLFDTSQARVKVAAEVHDYVADDHFSSAQQSQIDRFAQFALVATREALKHSGLEITPELAERTAVVHGTGIGGQTTQDDNYWKIYAENSKRVHPFTIPKLMPNAGTSQITMEFGITGPAFTTATACASSGHAIGMATLLLRSGMADVAITGGAEACITRGTMMGWEALRVAAKDTCRPFSNKRGGMVVGEGGATLVLETLEHAQARGAKIYAEITGFGMSADADSLVAPSADGAFRAIRGCLRDAGLATEDVQYINAHGTATPQNDPTETRAIRMAFGEHADGLAVSSTKSMHGHVLGGAAAMEAIATILALQEQTAPPTANFQEADPKCDLDYVPNEARPMMIQNALSNSFAFGGLNTVLAFRRFED